MFSHTCWIQRVQVNSGVHRRTFCIDNCFKNVFKLPYFFACSHIKKIIKQSKFSKCSVEFCMMVNVLYFLWERKLFVQSD